MFCEVRFRKMTGAATRCKHIKPIIEIKNFINGSKTRIQTLPKFTDMVMLLSL